MEISTKELKEDNKTLEICIFILQNNRKDMLNCVERELQRACFILEQTESTVCSCELEIDVHSLLDAILTFFQQKHKRDFTQLLCTIK